MIFLSTAASSADKVMKASTILLLLLAAIIGVLLLLYIIGVSLNFGRLNSRAKKEIESSFKFLEVKDYGFKDLDKQAEMIKKVKTIMLRDGAKSLFFSFELNIFKKEYIKRYPEVIYQIDKVVRDALLSDGVNQIVKDITVDRYNTNQTEATQRMLANETEKRELLKKLDLSDPKLKYNKEVIKKTKKPKPQKTSKKVYGDTEVIEEALHTNEKLANAKPENIVTPNTNTFNSLPNEDTWNQTLDSESWKTNKNNNTPWNPGTSN